MKSIGGPDLLIFLVLAFGGAMFVGNLMALVRPPSKRPTPKKGRPKSKPVALKRTSTEKSDGTNKPQSPQLVAAPKSRTIAMMTIGGVVSIWALATLLSR
jgi:hypothetical protein